jgi:hypothetical protein
MAGVRTYLTNFPQGMQSDIGIRNVPTVVTNSGRNVWVDSNGAGTGSASQRRGTFQRPYATVALALTAAQKYDTIFVKSGHAETIAAAGGWTPGVAGVRIVGVGYGDERPQITFAGAAGASILLNQVGCSLTNLLFINGQATASALTGPLALQASGVSIAGCEWRDSSGFEAVRAVLSTAAFKFGFIQLRYNGLTGSSTNVNAIRLVGSVDINIDFDFYGNASTSVIEFLTTACTGIFVSGRSYNQGGSSGTKIVTDNAGSSKWMMAVQDINNATKGTLIYSGA